MNVDCVSNGHEIIEASKQKHYDLIISDIVMPKINGLDAIETIKKTQPNLSTILITGFKEKKYLEKSIKVGINDFIPKPVDTELLVKSITSIYEEKIKIIKENEEKDKYINELLEYKLEISKQKDQLELTVRSLNNSNKKLKLANNKLEEQKKIIENEARIKGINETVKSLTHEWRQPLNIISVIAQKIKLEKQLDIINDDTLFNELDKIKETTEKLSDTLESVYNLLDEETKEYSDLNLIDISKNVIALLNNTQDIKDIEFELEYEEKDKNIYDIKSYKLELENLLVCFITNSIEAYRNNNLIKNRKIKLTFDVDEKYNHIIKIYDNAGGINKDILPMIFNPYFSTKKEKNGKGLSLYLAKATLEHKLNGNLIISNYNNGTKVEIKLKTRSEECTDWSI